MAQMVVTMQETFSGIRVIKSFAREGHQEKEFKRSNQQQFSQIMRMIRAMEAVGPLVEIIAAIGVGMALLYVYAANLSAGRFLGLMTGIFILYDPIKTLSRLHIVVSAVGRRDHRYFLNSRFTSHGARRAKRGCVELVTGSD